MNNESHNLQAFITGASSGIGAAFAKRLAQDKYDLVLHGRRKEKLKKLALDLEKNYNISVKTITAEFSRTDELKKVENYIQSLSLDMLVNNAGYWTPGTFWERDPDSLEAMIRVHVIAPVRFTRAALPSMLKRHTGSIINVSSISAYFAIPTLENYSATKSHLITFTEALHVALMGTGVQVQVLVPGVVLTEFHSRLGVNPEENHSKKMLLPKEVVDISLQDLTRGKVVCIPSLKDKIVVPLVNALPRPIYYTLMHNRGERIEKFWRKYVKK
jgi:short-subunit dehydrogenase